MPGRPPRLVVPGAYDVGLSREFKMTPINIRGQGRTPLPTAIGSPEDGAKPSRPILMTQRKLRSKAVLPPLAWAAGWARKPEPGGPS
jgi:hypothetical protein